MAEPNIVTLHTSELEDGQAKLHGEITDMGSYSEVVCYIFYTRDEDFINEVKKTDPIIFTSPQEFDFTVDGLKPEETYYFRVCGYFRRQSHSG